MGLPLSLQSWAQYSREMVPLKMGSCAGATVRRVKLQGPALVRAELGEKLEGATAAKSGVLHGSNSAEGKASPPREEDQRPR